LTNIIFSLILWGEMALQHPHYTETELIGRLANNDEATLRGKAQEAVQQCLQLLQAR